MRAALGAPVPGLFLYRGAARRPARRSDLYPARRPFGRAASDSARRRAAGAVYDAGRRGRARSARLHCARRTPCVRAAPPALFARAILPHAGGNVRALRRSASALANSVEIAKRCTLTLELGKAKLPLFPTPEALSLDAYLRQLAGQGLEARLEQLFADADERGRQRPVYAQRLAFECDTIIEMGFAGYFLIVADFINWAKNSDIPVGPGRGSGAGSLVAFALGITDLDPLRYNLLFERFLNPERVS